MYGVGSYAALGTTMGLFWEVPIMLGLVYLGKALRRRGFWASWEPSATGPADAFGDVQELMAGNLRSSPR
jgi:hypothetical protein